MIGENIKFFTLYIYLLIGLFTLFQFKKKWIWDSLYPIGMTVGLVGTLIAWKPEFIHYYADILGFPENIIRLFCVISHLCIVGFLFLYKPVLYGQQNILFSTLLTCLLIGLYLFFIDPQYVYPYYSITNLLKLSIGFYIILFIINYQNKKN